MSCLSVLVLLGGVKGPPRPVVASYYRADQVNNRLCFSEVDQLVSDFSDFYYTIFSIIIGKGGTLQYSTVLYITDYIRNLEF